MRATQMLSVNRRDLLKGAGALIVGIAAPTVLHAAAMMG